MVGRPWIQPGYSSAIDVANVQVVVFVHVTAERVARGDIQLAFRPAYAIPGRHEAAARWGCRQNSFNLRSNFIRVWNLERALRPYARLMRCGTGLERCAGNDVFLRQIAIAS
jgi:hypothetical protein